MPTFPASASLETVSLDPVCTGRLTLLAGHFVLILSFCLSLLLFSSVPSFPQQCCFPHIPPLLWKHHHTDISHRSCSPF